MCLCYQEWLRSYRLGDGARDGGVGVYTLSRQQLQRWYYVDKITNPTELQEKYRLECGVYADRGNLVRWLNVFSYTSNNCGMSMLFHCSLYLWFLDVIHTADVYCRF